MSRGPPKAGYDDGGSGRMERDNLSHCPPVDINYYNTPHEYPNERYRYLGGGVDASRQYGSHGSLDKYGNVGATSGWGHDHVGHQSQHGGIRHDDTGASSRWRDEGIRQLGMRRYSSEESLHSERSSHEQLTPGRGQENESASSHHNSLPVKKTSKSSIAGAINAGGSKIKNVLLPQKDKHKDKHKTKKPDKVVSPQENKHYPVMNARDKRHDELRQANNRPQQGYTHTPDNGAHYSSTPDNMAHNSSTESRASNVTGPIPENPILEGIDQDIQYFAEDVRRRTRPPDLDVVDIDENPSLPYDPNLVCPKCGKRYHIGEIQKFRRHVLETCPYRDRD